MANSWNRFELDSELEILGSLENLDVIVLKVLKVLIASESSVTSLRIFVRTQGM